ncbi:DUF4337 family protein [Lichenihabitans sp. Uapishka_5]|uniref:DUF4337 family protein n=1 Tax=Lichenihabitans sp. Uapishka_5 TaxID=3037302 RepID=UPI0029E7FAD9|nr:DUF4337 family protein [Lichenihabitans sp. Uapishka_5]MDX7951699.1 DUF4337 family protein [Lichenihabitans sp. Uapishka_5]
MDDMPTEAHEQAEHAEHAAHSGDRTLILASATIALMAVAAATVGSLETIESGKAISAKNESVLAQAKASDAWALYQAESIKRNAYEIAAETNADKAQSYRDKASGYAAEQTGSKNEAQRLEDERNGALAASEGHEQRHHVLTAGVTLIHVAIAVATLTIITRSRRPWQASLFLGGLGVAIAAYAYLG